MNYFMYIFRSAQLFCLMWVIFFLSTWANADTVIRVGVYDYAPMSTTQGAGKGGEAFFINILKHIAGEEKWRLQYVPGSLREGYQRLHRGEVDILVAAPFSSRMAKQFDFSGEAVISTWAQIYTPAGKPVPSILDLHQLEIGIVKDDPYNQELKDSLKKMSIKCRFVEFVNYDELCKAVQNEWVDAGAIDRLYGVLYGKDYALTATPIVFSPVELRFAVAKGRSPVLIETLNYHISILKNNRSSVYYQLINKMSGTMPDSRIAKVVKWILILAAISLVFFGLMILLLRFQIKKRTEQLMHKNEELRNENIMRQKAEEALKESEELYRTLSERSFANVWVVQDGRFRLVNDNTIKTLGYVAEEIIGQRSLQFVHEEDRERVKSCSLAMIEGLRSYPYEYRMATSGGDYRWMLETVTAIHYGGRSAVLGTALDVTERKKAEEERVMLESQLHQAQKMEAIGVLAGGIAHDFNNILTGISGYSELALRFLAEQTRERRYLEQVLRGCDRAKDLVNRILMFSRQGEQASQPIGIRPIIKEVVKLLRASLPSTIDIRLDLEAEEDTVLSDPTQIHQILMNLCTNAAHAMNGKGGLMTIRLRSCDYSPQTPRHVELSVQDTGHGISPAIIDRIFDPFFTTKEVGKGTGMGLSVVHGIVKSHGGQIQVESVVGKGSTFRIIFPLATGALAEDPQENAGNLPCGDERILWVDDEETLAEMGKAMLSGLGYEVTAVSSSPAAADLFRRDPDRFDMVITDMTMPKMTGIQLAGRIREIRSDIPIIICSGFSEEITPESLAASGIREFVKKPFSLEKIAVTIRRILAEKNDARPVIQETVQRSEERSLVSVMNA